jgi:hypothetical protein
VPGSKAAPSAKKCIIPAIGALAALSSGAGGGGGIDESSLHDPAPEVQSKANPRSPLAEPQAQSMTTPGQQSAAEVSLPIIPSVGAARALTGCF